ncbi:MAG: DUF6262 family protein [Actinobacteria bacterium]|nr:DUF6262 family protein [Actinomycetota bacterium]
MAERGGALAAAAQRKRDAALGRARAALRELDARGEEVNFSALARRAGVSRQWLYAQPELREEVERLRGRGGMRAGAIPAAERASDGSLHWRLEAALEDNRRLREQVAGLKDELAIAYGHRRDAALQPR